MDNIKNDIKQFKQELYQLQKEKEYTDYDKILTNKKINKEIQEILVLLHSAHMSELRTNKAHFIAYAQQLADILERMTDKVEKQSLASFNPGMNDMSMPPLPTESKSGILSNIGDFISKANSISTIWKVVIGIIILATFFVIGFELLPDSFGKSIDAIKSITGPGTISTSTGM